MGLQESEIDIVVESLVKTNPTIETLRAMLAAVVPAAKIPEIPQGASPKSDSYKIVRQLDRADPQSLLKIMKLYEVQADVAFLIKRYEDALRHPAAEPWRERLLWRRNVVLDRGPLRNALKTLLHSQLPNVLLVTGPTKSGKTRTAALVNYVASYHKHPHACVLNAAVLGAAGTVQQLLVQLGDSKWEVEEVASPDSHWYRKQCTRLIAAAKACMKEHGGERCWLVIDQLGASTGTVVELCDYLMQLCTPTTSGIRLVVLSYPRELPPDSLPDGAVEWDRLTYGMIAEADVRDYLTWLYDELAKQPLTAEALQSELQRLFAGTAVESEGFLKHIGESLDQQTRIALAEVP